jgi:UDP-2,4-diacetamido-2,4,6-trideoxy-beta-L-altropyranose hydrolase
MRVVFRVDASAVIGTGHVMRCLALAAGLRDEGVEVQFICRSLPTALATRIGNAGCALTLLPSAEKPVLIGTPAHEDWLEAGYLVDADSTIVALAGSQPDWLIVDHYALDNRWQGRLRGAVKRIAVIDDIADRDHDCDLLIDHNLADGGDRRYAGRIPSAAQRYLGLRYAILRPEFAVARTAHPRQCGAVSRVAVSFGGVDRDNLTSVALDAITQSGIAADVDVIIGAEHITRAELERRIGHHPRWHLHVQTDNIANIFSVSDIAIGAGGAATWERACLGLPSIAICVADNQVDQLHSAAKAGLLYSLTAADADLSRITAALVTLAGSPELRSHMARCGQGLVDGRGVQRLVRAFVGAVRLGIRKASMLDADMILAWRNHESTRHASASQDLISPGAHRAWMESTLASPDRHLLIGLNDDVPCGVMRYDTEGAVAMVSIYLAPGCSGHGLGTALLAAGESWLCRHASVVDSLVAHVNSGNIASELMFANAGYALSQTTWKKRVDQK